MGLLDAIKSALGVPGRERTKETIAASRATRRLIETFSEHGRIHNLEDIETVERVLAPPVDWQDLMRPPERNR